MMCVRTLLAGILLLHLASTYAADWQYAGNVDKDKASFFDAAGVQYPDKDTVRLWVKYIPEKTIKSYFNSKNREQVIEESASKMASGYIPEFFKWKYNHWKYCLWKFGLGNIRHFQHRKSTY